MNIQLVKSSKADPQVRAWMKEHYSSPRGFVGRQIIYKIASNGVFYGAIAAGSATRFLPGRNEFFGSLMYLDNVVNNTFFHVEKQAGSYPIRNFTSAVVKLWRRVAEIDWHERYGDVVFGWETLVELPRTGDLYLRDGWREVGKTKGFTCKRVAGRGSDAWSGKRVWNTTDLRPKRVFARWL